MGQGHDRRLAPVRRDHVADDTALVAQVRHLGDRLPVPGTEGDMLRAKQPGEWWREVDLERQGRRQGRQQPSGLLRIVQHRVYR
jgi:hypothetical protein